MRLTVWPALLCLLFAGIPGSYARSDRVPGSRYVTARAAALGNAFLPLAEDGAALFYNPASLGKVRRPYFEPFNFQLQMNQEYVQTFDTNFYKVTSLPSYQPVLDENPRAFPGVGAGLFPNFTTRGFGVGVLMQSRFASQKIGGDIRYRSQYQFIPTAGTGVSLGAGIVKLGYSVQWVNQAVGDRTVPADSSPLGYNQGLAEGSALSHTAGMTIALPYVYLPTFSVVARNIFGTRYGGSSIVPLARNKNGTPADEQMTLDAGFAYTNKLGRGASFNVVGEYRDITNRSQTAVFGRVAGGLEFSFRDQFFLRGGWGSGYPSAGIGLRRRRAEFGISWYSEEVGAGYHRERDIRYIFHYQVRPF